MPLKATERDVYEFFSKAGKVGRMFHYLYLKFTVKDSSELSVEMFLL